MFGQGDFSANNRCYLRKNQRCVAKNRPQIFDSF